MHPNTENRGDHIDSVIEYFRRSDAGRSDALDLFTDDVALWFPKFGIRHGKDGLAELAIGLMGSLSRLAHDESTFSIFAHGDTIVVEGTTYGADRAGNEWRGGQTPGGRFCSVFEFRGSLIARMRIYTDPDYAGLDDDRFLWGRSRSW